VTDVPHSTDSALTALGFVRGNDGVLLAPAVSRTTLAPTGQFYQRGTREHVLASHKLPKKEGVSMNEQYRKYIEVAPDQFVAVEKLHKSPQNMVGAVEGCAGNCVKCLADSRRSWGLTCSCKSAVRSSTKTGRSAKPRAPVARRPAAAQARDAFAPSVAANP
jgi:hypothetical protein